MKFKKIVSAFIAVVMCLTTLSATAFAQNGPNASADSCAYILFKDAMTNTNKYLYNAYEPDTVSHIDGCSYEKSTNTLTLDGYVENSVCIETNEMGDDFKICAIGGNEISELVVWGFGYGGSLEIKGIGSLTINREKHAAVGLSMLAEGADVSLNVGEKVTFRVYGTDMAIGIYQSASAGGLCFSNPPEGDVGMQTKTVKTNKTIKAIRCADENEFDEYHIDGDPATYLCNQFTRYDNANNPTVYYSMFVLYQTGGKNFALPLAEEQGLPSIPQKYEDAGNSINCYGDAQGQETTFVQLKRENSNEIYGTIEEYYSGIKKATAYKIISIPNSYNIAVPVDGETMLDSLPSVYSTVSGTDYYNTYATAKEVYVKPGHVHTPLKSITKATLTKNGKILQYCSLCRATISTAVIYYPKTIKLSTTSYTYNGSTKKPSVKVTDSRGKTISSAYYTVSYASGRKNVGKYAVKVTFKGNYSGSKTLYFTINPKSTSLKSVSAKSKAFYAKWSKQSTSTSGYQLQYSKSSKFSSAKIVKISSNKSTSKSVSKLKAKCKYYVRIRTYKKTSTGTFYSKWSSYKKVTTKK